MSECKTINCQTCGLKLEETFVEQKCPRCQTIIASEFICGSCHNCAETITDNKPQKENSNLFLKLLSVFTKK